MAAALEAAKDLREDQTCVVLCPDNIRNYMTKFVVDNWLEARNFKESVNVHCHSWWGRKVSELLSELQMPPQSTMLGSSSCQDVISVLKKGDVEQIPIVDDDGKLLGMATTPYLMNKLLNLSLKCSDSIEKSLFKKFIKITPDTTVGCLSRILEKESFVVVAGEKLQSNEAAGMR